MSVVSCPLSVVLFTQPEGSHESFESYNKTTDNGQLTTDMS